MMNTTEKMCEKTGHTWEYRLGVHPGFLGDIWGCRFCRAQTEHDPFVPAQTRKDVVSLLLCRNCAPYSARSWREVEWKEFDGSVNCDEHKPGCTVNAEFQLICSGYSPE